MGPECDVWSLGVVLYMMAVARIPFLGDNRRSTYQCIINGVYKQPSFLSDSLCHLISTMLETTVSARATLNDVARHPWVMDTPFLGKRPTDLMWFEDTNTCSSEYETSLRTSDFEKFGLDHHGHGSQTNTFMTFSERTHDHRHNPSSLRVSQRGLNGEGGAMLHHRHSSVGTNKIFESSQEGEEDGMKGFFDEEDEEDEEYRQKLTQKQQQQKRDQELQQGVFRDQEVSEGGAGGGGLGKKIEQEEIVGEGNQQRKEGEGEVGEGAGEGVGKGEREREREGEGEGEGEREGEGEGEDEDDEGHPCIRNSTTSSNHSIGGSSSSHTTTKNKKKNSSTTRKSKLKRGKGGVKSDAITLPTSNTAPSKSGSVRASSGILHRSEKDQLRATHSCGTDSQCESRGSEDTSEEEAGEDRKGQKKRDNKGKGREEKIKKPKRRKIRTESVESRVESLRRGGQQPKALKLQRGAINKDEITERSSSGPTPNFPMYKNSSEEMGASSFFNLLSPEDKLQASRISLSVGFGAFHAELDDDEPELGAGSGESLTALEFIRTSSPRKKRGFPAAGGRSDPLQQRSKKERPMSQLGYPTKDKKSKSSNKRKKSRAPVHDSADDAFFRGAEDSLFTSKSPKFLSRSSKTPTMSPGKSPKSPKLPKSPKSGKAKSPILPFNTSKVTSETKRKRRTMSRNKPGPGSGRGLSEDDAVFKEMEGVSEPQSFLLYSRKKSFSKDLHTPDQKKKDKGAAGPGHLREMQAASVQELPPPSREPAPEFYYGSQGHNVGSRPRRGSFTRGSRRESRRERKQSKDEGVHFEDNDPLIYALFRRFNFRKK